MLPPSSEHTATSSHPNPALPEHASPSSTGLPNDASQHPAGQMYEGKPRKSSWLRILILILLIGGAIGFVTYRIVSRPKGGQAGQGGPGGGGGRRGGGAGGITPVAFDVATRRTIPISLTALGTVTAYNTVTLKSRVDGQIIRVNFQEGQHVRRGQTLIEVDPRPYQATLDQALGNLTRDQANAANAQAEAARYNQLYSAGVVSREQTQAQESTAGQSVGTLAADRGAIEQARVNLNYTKITSPIDGIVGLRQVDIGNIVTAAGSTGLVVITQVQPIAVIFTLPEDQLPAVFDHMRGGRKLVAEAWDRSNTNKLATGSLMTIDNQIDTTTGTAKLKAVFSNAESALFPNQFVNIHLVLENRANSLVIPAAAVQTGNNGSFVYVIDRTKGQMGGAPGTGAGGRGGRGASGGGTGNAAMAGNAGAPAGGGGGGNTGASNMGSQGGGTVSDAPGGGSGAAPGASGTGTGAGGTGAGGPGSGGPENGSGGTGAGGRGAGGRGGRGNGGPQMNYPVKVVNIAIDSTQGTDVIIKSGLQPGQQVVTDGTEKLQDGARVIPRPSPELQAARQGHQPVSPENQPDTGAGEFNNGRNSDRDVAPGDPRRGTGDAIRGNRQGGGHGNDETGLPTSGPDGGGRHHGAYNGGQNSGNGNAADAGQGQSAGQGNGRHHRPNGGAPTQ